MKDRWIIISIFVGILAIILNISKGYFGPFAIVGIFFILFGLYGLIKRFA